VEFLSSRRYVKANSHRTVVSGGRCVLSIVRNGPCQLQCCSHPEQTDYLSFASVSRRVQMMISADYDVSTRWIIAPDDVTGTPVSTINSSAVSVFERYTWTQFLQVCASVVGDVVSPPARAARNAVEGGPMFCLCFLFVFCSNDFCQANCLDIYRADLHRVFGLSRTVAVNERPEVIPSFEGHCHGSQFLLVL